MPTSNVDGLFVDNRQRLIEKLPGAIVVVTAYALMQRSSDVAAPFEQEANFWWLAGIEEPDWWLIIDGQRGRSWLVAPGNQTDDAAHETLRVRSGVNGMLTQDAGMQLLRELAKKHSIVRTLGDPTVSGRTRFTLNPAPKRLHDMLGRLFNGVQDCRRELAQLRAVKQPEEIMRIKKATSLTIAAFQQAKSILPNAQHEYEIEAELAYYFRKHGASSHAYNPVVAAGGNACDLQYAANAAKLKKRELVLLDTGARWQGYGASVARTYGYGQPTRRQQAVYDAVRTAHIQILKLLGPDLAVDQYQRDVDGIMRDALLELGLISDGNGYFPHAISHGVGIDAYESLGASRTLQSGMVLTVEPGVYIPEEGIGVRLGDTVLITSGGMTNLSGPLSTDL